MPLPATRWSPSLSAVRDVLSAAQPSAVSGRFATARPQVCRGDLPQRGAVVSRAAVDGGRSCMAELIEAWPASVHEQPAVKRLRTGFRRIWRAALLALLESLQARQRDADSFFFRGVNAPVNREVFSQDLEVVQGAVPPELDGIYIRTGPNAQHKPKGGYVMVDGEAMLHAVHLSGGKALSYCNHWLRCPRFLHEQANGENLYIRIGDIRGIIGIAILTLTQKFSWIFEEPDEYLNYQLGNTSLCWHNGRLLALMEGGMPFEAHIRDDGQLASVGPFDFDGEMTAATSGHPKVCPLTGELHSFFYRVTKTAPGQHLCVYHKASPDGRLSQDYPVSISRGQMMHDFAITERFAVFCDAAVVFNPVHMITENGLPFETDTKHPCRIGLLDRADPSKPVRWFKTPAPFAFFHTANAWEDGSKVHLVLCRFESLNLSQGLVKGFVEDVPELYRFTIDTEAGHVDADGDIVGAVEGACLVPGRSADFPVVPQELLGRKHRFCYAAVADDTKSDCGGACCDVDGDGDAGSSQKSTKSIIKVDMWAAEGRGLQDRQGRRREIVFGEGVIGGEATFVARDSDAMLRRECAEDDGFLVVYVTDTNGSNDAEAMESYCVVYDAQTMSSEPLAKIKMPQRVPLGLHGAFISAQMLRGQVLPHTVLQSDLEHAP